VTARFGDLARAAATPLVVFAAGVALCALYLLLPEGLPADVVYELTATGSVVAIVVGARRHAGRHAARWYLLAAGIGLWALGDWVWDLEYTVLGGDRYPSLADVFYLAAYPVLAAAYVLVVRGGYRRGRATLVDSAVVAVGAGLVMWMLLFQGRLETEGTTLASAVTLAYPLGDMLLLGLLAGLVFVPGRRAVSYWLLVSGLAVTLVADAAFAAPMLAGTAFSGRNLDVLWLAGYVLVAVAALHPSMRAGAVAQSHEREASPIRYIIVLGLSALAGAAANLFELTTGVEVDSLAWVLGSSILAALVAVRLAVLIRQGEKLRQNLAEQNSSLRELDRLKDSFVATVSHELRTPLTSIRGYLELLIEGEAGELNEDQLRFLRIVERNGDRLLGLVGDLLFVAQVDAGGMLLETGPVDLAALADDCVQSSGPAAEARGIALALKGDPELPLTGDAKRLAQLLDNLVSNALKFTPPGGTVTVRTRIRQGTAILEVEDTGMGVAPADQARLFDRFYRTSAAGDHAIQGTGLGLAITKAIVESHGGTISVTSTERVGSTFRVELPIAAPVEAPGELVERAA
jgi:signal transduction histidine kinase